ncbi:MAG: ABC transporter permease [Candidatus Dormibacteria bacterium]|jgi:putative ABC transport system permease protein
MNGSRTAWLRSAAEEISANRSRSLLAMLSIVIGVWSVSVVVAAGDVASQALVTNVEETLGYPATVSAAITSPPPAWPVPTLRTSLASLMTRYHTPLSSPLETSSAHVSISGRSARVTLDGVTPEFSSVQLLPLTEGRWLDPSDARDEAPNIVLNTQAVQALGLRDGTPVLGTVVQLGTLQPVAARIVGVLSAPNQQGPALYLPVQLLERYGIPPGSPAGLTYLIRVPPAQVDEFMPILKSDLDSWGLGSDAVVERVDQAGALTSGLVAVQLVLAAIAGLALITGGIGVLNLALLSVRERVHEFGIRRAFGATRRSLFVTVLAETVLTTLVAGAVGTVLAGVSFLALPGILGGFDGGVQVSVAYPFGASLLGVGLAAVLGVVAGVVPAMRATRLSVVEAIRR